MIGMDGMPLFPFLGTSYYFIPRRESSMGGSLKPMGKENWRRSFSKHNWDHGISFAQFIRPTPAPPHPLLTKTPPHPPLLLPFPNVSFVSKNLKNFLPLFLVVMWLVVKIVPQPCLNVQFVVKRLRALFLYFLVESGGRLGLGEFEIFV